jgi:hypothetical protein
VKLPRRRKIFRADIHLKGGGRFALYAEEFTVKRIGADFSGVEWGHQARGGKSLGFDLREVQAVTVVPWGHHWRR